MNIVKVSSIILTAILTSGCQGYALKEAKREFIGKCYGGGAEKLRELGKDYSIENFSYVMDRCECVYSSMINKGFDPFDIFKSNIPKEKLKENSTLSQKAVSECTKDSSFKF